MKIISSTLLALLLSLNLVGCQSTQSNTPSINYALLNTPEFEQKEIVSQDEVFALNEDIKTQLDQYIKDKASPIRQAKQLLNFFNG
ncbi:hypothetical protein [Pseudoalteromonas phenolica]|uniref:hypothetical protein n=1 Tax=Pseudoalteromonas phenolica TaxID=161398 RepID=UPI001F4F3E4D|nr:hypothetical protein [Pseudoalteromonas phenolica]